MVCLGGLWLLKSTQASLIFPLMVLALVGFRKIMDFFPTKNKPWFSQNDLFWLDNLMPSSNDKKSEDSEENSKDKVRFLSVRTKKNYPGTNEIISSYLH